MLIGVGLFLSWGCAINLAADADTKNEEKVRSWLERAATDAVPVPLGKEFRSWVVPDPLYEELLTDEPPGLRSQGSIIWQHILDVPVGRAAGVRFATRYVSDDVYRDHARAGLHLVASRPGKTDDLEAAKRWKLTMIPVGPIPRSTWEVPVEKLQSSDVGWLLDPRAIEFYLAGVEGFFTDPNASMMWAIFAGDEHDEVAVRNGPDLMAKAVNYAYIKEADAEVKREFGGGKWGIPKGIKEQDPNPYKWIAFRRWVNAKLRDRHRRLRVVVKRNNPDMPIVSVDPAGIAYELHAGEYSTQPEFFDIFSHQIGYPGVGDGPGGVDRWRNTVGLVSKFMSDLTGKEFWPVVHIESCNYPDARPEEVVEELSQVFRNGGTGLHLFLLDIANMGKLVGDTRTSYFGSPRRYHTIMNICRLIRTMPKLKLPEYDRTAILYNDDTLAATPYDGLRPYTGNVEACYMMIGPVARSWFKFIDCPQVVKWNSLHDRFDIIYLPTAKYQRSEIVAKFKRFVEAGGTLVCGDPGAFDTDLLGNDTVASRNELFGVTVGQKLGVKRLVPKDAGLGEKLALRGAAYELTPVVKVEVLATYEDGSPAITANTVGKGRAILFGTNPFVKKNVPDSQWRVFFTAWVKSLGAPTGLDIWRFRLPKSVIWHEPRQPGVCLTNNRVRWQEEKPSYSQNVDVTGTYSYIRPPDAMSDVPAENGKVSFAEGRLTDRRKSILAKKEARGAYKDYELPASHWMVGWSRTDPVSIVFDLKQPRPLLQLKLWFNDTMPAVTAEGSTDGQQWQPLGTAVGQEAGADTYDLVISLNNELPSRYLRATFAARRPGQKLSIVETEVWAEDGSN